MHKNFFLFISFFCLLLVTPHSVSASYSDSLSVENHIQTGDIHIQLEEYQTDASGRESRYDFDGLVLPGDTISKIPRITNLAEPCYIRIYMTFPDTQTDISGLSAENLDGISEKWIQIQDYYYYPEVLNTNESLDFFQAIHIPANWENEHTGQTLEISLQVDAIQAQNFSPDFTSDTPWGDQIIEICAHNQSEPSLKNPYESMYVEFEGNSHKLITVSKDFFSNLGKMMPGDILTDEIILRNTTNSNAEFFFQTAVPESTSSEALDLLELISLEITLDQEPIYTGNLRAASLEDPISLGTYGKGESRIFQFTLSLPKTATNIYALRKTSVKWIFSVKNEELTISTPSPVKTGDTMTPFHYLILLLSSLFLAGCFAVYQKRKEIFHHVQT